MEYECLREEKFGLLWPDAANNQREDLIAWVFNGMVHSLLFRIPLLQLAYFQFPVFSNKKKFVLALVINIIFPVIYFYDDNPLRLKFLATLWRIPVCFGFHTANCSQAKVLKACMQWKTKTSTNANRQEVNSLTNKRITKRHIFVICLVLLNSELKEFNPVTVYNILGKTRPN